MHTRGCFTQSGPEGLKFQSHQEQGRTYAIGSRGRARSARHMLGKPRSGSEAEPGESTGGEGVQERQPPVLGDATESFLWLQLSAPLCF